MEPGRRYPSGVDNREGVGKQWQGTEGSFMIFWTVSECIDERVFDSLLIQYGFKLDLMVFLLFGVTSKKRKISIILVKYDDNNLPKIIENFEQKNFNFFNNQYFCYVNPNPNCLPNLRGNLI